jgi:hypothetical protein
VNSNLYAQCYANIAPLVLHPYYKLDYIEMAWGGAKEQAEEHAAGNLDAKDWQDEARKVVEQTVSILHLGYVI